MAAYPASRLAKLVASDQPVPAHPAPASSVVEPPRSQPERDGGGIALTTIGLVGGGAFAVAVLLLFAVGRRAVTRANVAEPAPVRPHLTRLSSPLRSERSVAATGSVFGGRARFCSVAT